MSESQDSQVATRRSERRRGIIGDMLDLLVDNPLLTHSEVAVTMGLDPSYVRGIRKSGTFLALLNKAREDKYGNTQKTLQQATLDTALTALGAITDMMKSEATLPSVKLEAAEKALEHLDRVERRSMPQGPGSGNNTTVNITLTPGELQTAREKALRHGQTIELEGNGRAHSSQIPTPGGGGMLPFIPTRGDKI